MKAKVIAFMGRKKSTNNFFRTKNNLAHVVKKYWGCRKIQAFGA